MSSDQPNKLTQSLKSLSQAAGFFLCGAAPAVTPPHYAFFCEWLEKGYSGTMEYLPERREAYAHPRSILDGVRSVMMLGASYYNDSSHESAAGEGRIARYAWNPGDYHDWVHERLRQVVAAANRDWPDCRFRGVVDTAPLLERDFARLAGLGWVGKNTMLINKRAGSYFFLAAILSDAPLVYDAPHESDHCGTCTRCLEACPTAAFPEPGVLDATRCISYLTIEHRGPVAMPLRTGIGDWWFGCDVCQDVCPWNRHASNAESATPSSTVIRATENLLELFAMSEADFRTRFRKTPIWRTKRSGALRNAAYVLGNQRLRDAVPTLVRSLQFEEDSTIRGAVAWALGQIGGTTAREALLDQSKREADEVVSEEIASALGTPM